MTFIIEHQFKVLRLSARIVWYKQFQPLVVYVGFQNSSKTRTCFYRSFTIYCEGKYCFWKKRFSNCKILASSKTKPYVSCYLYINAKSSIGFNKTISLSRRKKRNFVQELPQITKLYILSVDIIRKRFTIYIYSNYNLAHNVNVYSIINIPEWNYNNFIFSLSSLPQLPTPTHCF